MKTRRFVIASAAIALAAFGVGVAIPKLTVRDLVSADERVKRCAFSWHYDTFFERAAMYVGKSRIVSATQSSAEIESFTLFRIPLGVLRGDPAMRQMVFCTFVGDAK